MLLKYMCSYTQNCFPNCMLLFRSTSTEQTAFSHRWSDVGFFFNENRKWRLTTHNDTSVLRTSKLVCDFLHIGVCCPRIWTWFCFKTGTSPTDNPTAILIVNSHVHAVSWWEDLLLTFKISSQKLNLPRRHPPQLLPSFSAPEQIYF